MTGDLLTVREAARMLGVTKERVRHMIRDGELQVVVLPHTGTHLVYRVRRASIDVVRRRYETTHN